MTIVLQLFQTNFMSLVNHFKTSLKTGHNSGEENLISTQKWGFEECKWNWVDWDIINS